jgi:hypothetical protein
VRDFEQMNHLCEKFGDKLVREEKIRVLILQ